MENPAILQQSMNQLSNDLGILQSKIAEVKRKQALYNAARAKRPQQFPDTWEPIIDDAGNLIGWLDSTSDAYKHI